MPQYRVTETPGFMVAKLHQRSLALYREVMEDYDLTPPQYGVLAALGDEDGLIQRQLGDSLEIDRATLSGILERLGKLGYVARRPDTQDRRAVIVTLTDQGRKLLEDTWPLTNARNEYLLDLLTAEERQQFVDLLRLLLPELILDPEESAVSGA